MYFWQKDGSATSTTTPAPWSPAASCSRRAGRATVRANQEADTARRLLYAADLNLAQEKYRAAEIGAVLRLLEETRPDHASRGAPGGDRT